MGHLCVESTGYLHAATTTTVDPPRQYFCYHIASVERPVVPPLHYFVIEKSNTVHR